MALTLTMIGGDTLSDFTQFCIVQLFTILLCSHFFIDLSENIDFFENMQYTDDAEDTFIKNDCPIFHNFSLSNFFELKKKHFY